MPWIKVAFLVSKQTVVINMPVKGCKTQDNVTVQINLSIVFRIMGDERYAPPHPSPPPTPSHPHPRLRVRASSRSKGEDPSIVRNFVYRVTPRGLEQQLKDACEEATRAVARSLQHTEIYGLRTDMSGKRQQVMSGADETPLQGLEGDSALRDLGGPADSDAAAAAANKGSDRADAMRRQLNDQFMPQGVSISDVIITDVQLPDVIVQQMAEKTTVIAQNAAQKMNQEYEMLTLKQQEEIETLRQRKREERDKERQSGDQKVNEIQVQLDKMKAETKVRLAKIQQESAVTVQNTKANGELEVAKLEQKKQAVLTEMQANATATAQKTKAETVSAVCMRTTCEPHASHMHARAVRTRPSDDKDSELEPSGAVHRRPCGEAPKLHLIRKGQQRTAPHVACGMALHEHE